MLNILLKFFNNLFPLSPDLIKIKNENNFSVLRFLKPQTIGDTVALTNFDINTIKSLIRSNKFHNSKHASKLLGTILEKWLTSIPNQNINTALIPIPLSKERQKERGYNQVIRVIDEINLKNFYKVELLERKVNTAPQTSLSRKQRLNNMKNVFAIKKDVNISNYQRVILIDDVSTTGATMISAKNILKSNLPKECELICLALAH